MIRLAARGVRAEWEPGCGHLPMLEIGGASVLYAAPWRAEPGVQADSSIPIVDRRLGGSFVCVPFGLDDVDQGPPHGRAANAPWTVSRVSSSALTARCRLSRGQIEARIALRDDHPVLYQTHILELDAPCTFAHHPMFRVAGGGRLSGPRPSAVMTYAAEAPVYIPEQRVEGWHLDTPDGPRDLRDIPAEPHEDFVALTGRRQGLSWIALRRDAEGDTILLLARAEQLPVTMLWLSNGARVAAPWKGRFRHVIGVEQGCCAAAEGTAAALSGQSRIAAEGLPTALRSGRHLLPHAIIRLPDAVDISDVSLAGGLTIWTETGPRPIPFDESHFA